MTQYYIDLEKPIPNLLKRDMIDNIVSLPHDIRLRIVHYMKRWIIDLYGNSDVILSINAPYIKQAMSSRDARYVNAKDINYTVMDSISKIRDFYITKYRNRLSVLNLDKLLLSPSYDVTTFGLCILSMKSIIDSVTTKEESCEIVKLALKYILPMKSNGIYLYNRIVDTCSVPKNKPFDSGDTYKQITDLLINSLDQIKASNYNVRAFHSATSLLSILFRIAINATNMDNVSAYETYSWEGILSAYFNNDYIGMNIWNEVKRRNNMDLLDLIESIDDILDKSVYKSISSSMTVDTYKNDLTPQEHTILIDIKQSKDVDKRQLNRLVDIDPIAIIPYMDNVNDDQVLFQLSDNVVGELTEMGMITAITYTRDNQVRYFSLINNQLFLLFQLKSNQTSVFGISDMVGESNERNVLSVDYDNKNYYKVTAPNWM